MKIVKEGTNIISAFTIFALNYKHDFMQQVNWKTNQQHMDSKWESVCKSDVDGYGRMVKFWVSLDEDNRQALVDYILKEYDHMLSPSAQRNLYK